MQDHPAHQNTNAQSNSNAIPCLIQQAAKQFGDRVAIISHDNSLTYQDLETQVQAMADFFRQSGIAPGTVVQTALPNSLPLIIALFGLIRLGAIACPLNPKFPDRQIQNIAQTIGTRWHIGNPIQIALSGQESGNISLDDIETVVTECRKTESPAKPKSYAHSPLTPCSLILTSGTSGAPKAAAFGYQNHYLSALGANRLIPLGAGDRYLLSLPLFHIGGMAILFRCLLGGATLVLSKFKSVFTDINQQRITHASLVTVQLMRLLNQGAPKSLKHLLIGGGPVQKSLLEKASDTGLNCWHTYGLTEMSSQVYTHDPSGLGHTLQHREIKLNAHGEILVRGETLFLGYWNKANLRLPVDNEGWFATGDLGALKTDHLEIIGRKDNQFISGGENIQPEEIEYVINQIKGVGRCLVAPQFDPVYGFRPVVFIEGENDEAGGLKISLEQLQNNLKPLLPSFKIPKAIYPWQTEAGLKPSRQAYKHYAAKKSGE